MHPAEFLVRIVLGHRWNAKTGNGRQQSRKEEFAHDVLRDTDDGMTEPEGPAIIGRNFDVLNAIVVPFTGARRHCCRGTKTQVRRL